jgi:ParB/RepB/Spo0J family partition protein
MTTLREIPLNKLVPSAANVRKTGASTGIEELAASIAAYGLLQNLSVRPVLDGENAETGKFEVVAGARRFAAMKLLAKQKKVPKAAPVPCIVQAASDPTEIGLAENFYQLPMHPADQYEAFAKLHGEQGMRADDIAARFGLTPIVVRQRLKLGADHQDRGRSRTVTTLCSIHGVFSSTSVARPPYRRRGTVLRKARLHQGGRHSRLRTDAVRWAFRHDHLLQADRRVLVQGRSEFDGRALGV